MAEELPWPPKKEDLERLYLVEKLSAAKIAKVYGLRYASPKTSESTVLYHLKKNGIQRRGPADHIHQPSAQIVKNWERMYHGGESLKQIAGTEYSPVTVWHHLKSRGVKLRDKVEAQIKAVSKHRRLPFSGDLKEKAYLIGLAWGDLHASMHGRAVRLKTATTHPSMIELLSNLFGSYGHIMLSPRHSGLAGYEWSFQVDLDPSFSFLIQYRRSLTGWILRPTYFIYFAAGFFDAEGSVWLNESTVHGFEVSYTNSDRGILERIFGGLKFHGLEFHLGYNKRSSVWRLYLWRQDEVERFLSLLPLRHPEKVAKAAIALRLGQCVTPTDYSSLVGEWNAKIREIKTGRDAFVHEAKVELARRSRQMTIGC